MFGLAEGNYDGRTLVRNRIAVGVLFVAAVAACALGAALTEWPWSNAIAMMIFSLVVALLLWWMFASAKAGPVRLTRETEQGLKRTFWMR